MQKPSSSSPLSFAFFLAGALALSGLFFTQALAEDEVLPVPEVTFDTSVVSEALSFIAEQGVIEEESSSVVVEVAREGEVSVETSVEISQSFTTQTTYEEPACPMPEDHSSLPVTLVITKIKCATESDLPNWGLGGPDITANTASDFLASHPSCHSVDHWGFEWGTQSSANPGDDFVWEAGSSRGWTNLGYTNASGILSTQITLPAGISEIRVREILEPGYLPFSNGANGGNSNNVSAELYCSTDVINYDNFDFVRNPVAGQTYHCVAWNVRNSAVNHPPVITLVGETPVTITVGGVFVDQGATSTDPEDGVLTPVVTGSVNTAVVGTYTIRYTATDSGGLSVFVERTVNVIPSGPVPACADGIDNDTPADGLIDFPADLGCDSATDTNENNPPAITLIGENPTVLIVGTSFVDQGATATDAEDGVLIPVVTGTVSTSTVGVYTLTYVATDSQGLSATTTRTVNIVPANTTFACSDGVDNDIPADGLIDFPADAGCTSATDNDENNAPIITLVGENVLNIIVGNSYTDLGATATDTEDGNITTSIIATGTVNTSAIGTYTISYNVTDSKGLAATEVTRTVNIVPAPVTPPPGGGGGGGSTPAKCANGQDDDADGKADYPADPGCTSSLDNDETDTTGGGGGVGLPGLQIFNERLTVVTPTSVKITWNTNLLADSRVVYGDLSKNPIGNAPQYGYPSTTATATAATSSHEMTITGLPENAVAFFRPVSSNGVSTVVGVELVTPLVAGSCTYLEKYLRIGYDNDPVEVTKLQRFLKEYEGFTNLAVTGIFDIETDKAVRVFQNKYGTEILAPWALPADTGYVYYTTKKKVNEIYCKKAFPLDSAQLREIDEYTSVLRGNNTHVSMNISDIPVSQPTVTVTRAPLAPSTGGSVSVIDLSKIDLSDIAPKTPVVALVPQETEGELASGVTTEEVNALQEEKRSSFLLSLLASVPETLGFSRKNTEEKTGSSSINDTSSTTNPCDASMTSSSTPFIAGVAASMGVSTGTFVVWIILFAGIIVLGYIMARNNRQTI